MDLDESNNQIDDSYLYGVHRQNQSQDESDNDEQILQDNDR